MKHKYAGIVLGDVATVLGVSKSTVSRALSGKGRVSAKTRKRIVDYIQELQAEKSSFETKRCIDSRNVIGVVFPDAFSEGGAIHAELFLRGVDESCECVQKLVVVSRTRSNIRKIIQNECVSGLLFWENAFDEGLEKVVQSSRIPYLNLSDITMASYEKATFQITRGILEELEEQNVMLVGWEQEKERNDAFCRGFRKALLDTGKRQQFIDAYLHIEGVGQLRSILQTIKKHKVNALLCADEKLCFLFDSMQREMGIEPVKVISLYSIAGLGNQYAKFPRVEYDCCQMGREAVYCLEKGNRVEIPNIKLPYKICI